MVEKCTSSTKKEEGIEIRYFSIDSIFPPILSISFIFFYPSFAHASVGCLRHLLRTFKIEAWPYKV